MTDTPQLLLGHHLKVLKLPTFLREYDKLARQCAAEGVEHTGYLLRLAELELIEREHERFGNEPAAVGPETAAGIGNSCVGHKSNLTPSREDAKCREGIVAGSRSVKRGSRRPQILR